MTFREALWIAVITLVVGPIVVALIRYFCMF